MIESIEETDLRGQTAGTDVAPPQATSASTATDVVTGKLITKNTEIEFAGSSLQIDLGLVNVETDPVGEVGVPTAREEMRTDARADASSVEAEDTSRENAGRGAAADRGAQAGAEAMQKEVTEDDTQGAELHQEGDTRAPVEAGPEVNAVTEATDAAPLSEAETAEDPGPGLILTDAGVFQAVAGLDPTVKTGRAEGVSLQKTQESLKRMESKIRQAHRKSLASLAVTLG